MSDINWDKVDIQKMTARAAKKTPNKKIPVISLGKDFGEVVVKANGAVIRIRADGTVLSAAKTPLQPGAPMADGSVFAGLTADKKFQILVMPADIGVTLTFNDAAEAVENMNSNKVLGHDDWQIPSLENLRVLQKNQNEGALKDTFETAVQRDVFDFSKIPGWYWSSSPGGRDDSSFVHVVRFSDGGEDCYHKDTNRLSCRPVRLVEAPRP